jgi:hypothetical protein
VTVTQIKAEQMSDDELASIAKPSSGPTLEAEKDPEEVFRVGEALQRRAGGHSNERIQRRFRG